MSERPFGTIPRGSHPGSVSTPPRPPPPARATGKGRPQFDTERPVPETPPATLEGDDEEQASFSQGGSSLLDGATAQPQQSRDTASPVGGSHSAAKRGRARVPDDEQDPSEPSTFCQVLYRNWKGTWGHLGRKAVVWAFWAPASDRVQLGIIGKDEELECVVCHAQQFTALHPMVPRAGEYSARDLDVADVTTWLPENSNSKPKSKTLLGQHTM
jgi:hypothetical protein